MPKHIDSQELFEQIEHSIEQVIRQKPDEGALLWKKLCEQHPADIAQFLSQCHRDDAQQLFIQLPPSLKLEVFSYCSDPLKVDLLARSHDSEAAELLNVLQIDQLTDLFDLFTDQQLEKYVVLLNAQDRQSVLALLSFDPESAGGIMDTQVLSLKKDYTVEKTIQLLQRIRPQRELHQQIFVTNGDNQLAGHINLEDLVLQKPQARIGSFMRENELVAQVNQDREDIAKQMIHYHLMTVPVVGDNNYFLGVIPSDILVNVIEQEASEDVYKISAMAPIKQSYFETSFWRILYERSYILIALLLAQSLSSIIIKHYEATLTGFLMLFITMLTSTGGNSSSQTSALVIQGMASGEINDFNVVRFLRRELRMAFMIAIILGFFSFIRVYLTHHQLLGSIAVSASLSVIVLVSVVLGSGIPIALKRLKFDPAFAAGPFLATIMDIIGLLIYCYLCKLILT